MVSSKPDTKTRLQRHARQMRLRSNISLVLIAALIVSSFVLMQSLLYVQELRVRVSAYAAEQSRLFSDISSMTRSLMLTAAADNVPEASLDSLRARIKQKTTRVRSNMHEIVSISENPFLRHFETESNFRMLADVEVKLGKYLNRADEIASIETARLHGRMQQWSPIDVIVSSATLVQSHFDEKVRHAFEATEHYSLVVRYIEGLMSVVALLLIGLEAAYIFAPLMKQLENEHDTVINQQNELYIQARIDGLTGLGNRVAFQDRLSADLAQAEIEHRPVGLVLFDLNHFKPVNDAFGHPAGDALLKAVAERARTAAGEQGFVARLGGDEFAILSVTAHDAASMEELVGRVSRAIRQDVIYAGQTLRPAAAFGGAILTDIEPNSPEVLFTAADTALYQAKRQSLGFVLLDDAVKAQLTDEKQLAQEFRHALSEDELKVFYQPQVRLADGLIVGFEALVRWAHPQRGLLEPEFFLQMAQRDGLITTLTERVVDRVARDIRAWMDLGCDPGMTSVNFPRAMLASGIAQRVLTDALARNAVDHHRLGIEVTEDVFMNRGADAVTATLRALREDGIRVSVDEFGTGYSSLYRLKSFPMDEIKIDRCFMQDYEADHASSEFVISLIRMGKHLDKTVVVQGIETADHLRFLLEAGCSIGQGFLFSEPVPFEGATGLIRAKYIRPACSAETFGGASRSVAHALVG